LETLNVGRFALPIAPVLLLGAWLVGSTAAKWNSRRGRVDVESLLWAILITGVATGRAAFVLLYVSEYKSDPWRILDMRDGGFVLSAGVAAVVIATAWLAWRKQQARKPLLYSVLAGTCFWLAGVLAVSVGNARQEQMPLPDLSLTTLEGTTVRTSSLKGKPLVINLWATWCPPCRRELPVLRDAQSRNRDVTFAFVDQGEAPATVRDYLASQGLTLDNVLLDPEFVMGRQADAHAFPTTLFFDEQGVLADRHMGELSGATLAKHLETLRRADQGSASGTGTAFD
jgi:thiol-disulfide isomerase/thioredoxin